MGNILVVKTYTHLSRDDREKLRASIQEQIMKGEVVILPRYTDAIVVPDDVSVEVETLGGENHFMGGEYYRGKASQRYFKAKNSNA